MNLVCLQIEAMPNQDVSLSLVHDLLCDVLLYCLFSGRSHDSNYKLFSVGETVTPAVKEFTETGNSNILDGETQGRNGILDIFYAPAIGEGVGQATTKFYADGRYSKVSYNSGYVCIMCISVWKPLHI